MEELLQVDTLGRWKVTCTQPKTDSLKYGVIFPISLDTDVQQLLDLIQIKNHSVFGNEAKAITIERLKKKTNTGWEDSTCIKIGFKATELPTAITICHSYYKVKPYVYNSLQCYNCNRIGHTAGSCKSQPRCMLCSGNHSREDCPVRDGNSYLYMC